MSITHSFTLMLFHRCADGHHGDHGKLSNTIQTLAQDRAGSAQIKLCLTNRPEPFFRATLSQYPRFTIQQQTRQDTKFYVRGRIDSSLAAYAGSYCLRELGILTDEITNKASGVFLWVRLVVEELIEGIIDASNIIQTPSDLGTNTRGAPGVVSAAAAGEEKPPRL